MAGSSINFIGRAHEWHLLSDWQTRLPGGQLTVVHGRRRVGKTRLINEVFSGKKILRFEGLEGGATAAQ